VFELLEGLFLLIEISTLPRHKQVPVNLMPIKVRPINTGEFCSTVNRYTTTATHTGSIYHIEFRLTIVFTLKGWVVLEQNFIIIAGPMAMTRSTFCPDCKTSCNGTVTTALRP